MPRETKFTPEQAAIVNKIKTVKAGFDDGYRALEAQQAQERYTYRDQMVQLVEYAVSLGVSLNHIALKGLGYTTLTSFQNWRNRHLVEGQKYLRQGVLPTQARRPPAPAAPAPVVAQPFNAKDLMNVSVEEKLVKWEDYNDWDTFYAAFEVGDYLFKSDDEKYDFQVISKRDARPGLGPSSATVDFHFPMIEDNHTNTFFFTIRENATTGVQLSASNMDDRMEDITRQLLSEAFPDAHFTLAFDNRRPRVASTGPAPAINYADDRVQEGGYMALKTHGEGTSMVEKYGITREGIENTPVESWHRKSTTPLGSVERKKD